MAFVSMMFVGLFLIMGMIGFVFLLIAMIFCLVNWHRKKKGKEKKRGYKIAGILFIVLAGINLAPILLTLAMAVIPDLFKMAYDSGIYLVMGMIGAILLAAAFVIIQRGRKRRKQGENVKPGIRIIGKCCLILGSIQIAPAAILLFDMLAEEAGNVSDYIAVSVMPERAIQDYYPAGDTRFGEQEFIEYQDAKYPIVPYDPESEIKKLKYSKPKARLQYRTGGDELVVMDSIVYEVQNEMGFDLLCLGDCSMYASEVYLSGLYCREDQYEQLIQVCRADAEYYLVLQERSDDYDEDEEEESERLFIPDSNWISDEILDIVEKEEGEKFPAPEKYFELHAVCMNGMLSGYCDIDIGEYEGKWYCYSEYYSDGQSCMDEGQSYVGNACLLPEEGQRLMDAWDPGE